MSDNVRFLKEDWCQCYVKQAYFETCMLCWSEWVLEKHVGNADSMLANQQEQFGTCGQEEVRIEPLCDQWTTHSTSQATAAKYIIKYY